MAMLDKIQEAVYTFLSTHPTISSLFRGVYSSPKVLPENDSLMIDLISVEEFEYYGYFIVSYIFGIVTDKRSKLLTLLDCLFQNVHKRYYRTSDNSLSLYFYYTGNYDEVLDTAQNRIINTTIWRIRAVKLS